MKNWKQKLSAVFMDVALMPYTMVNQGMKACGSTNKELNAAVGGVVMTASLLGAPLFLYGYAFLASGALYVIDKKRVKQLYFPRTAKAFAKENAAAAAPAPKAG